MSPIDTGGQNSGKGYLPERWDKKRPFDLPYAPYNPLTGKFHTPYQETGGGGTTAVMAEIVSEVGAGVYKFRTKFGDGPAGEDNDCTELNLSTGIGDGTVVVCHDVDGTYYFFFPVGDCP